MLIVYGEEATAEYVKRRLYCLDHSQVRPSQDSERVLKPSYDMKMNQEKVDQSTSTAIDQAKDSNTMNQQPQQGGSDDVSCLQQKSVMRIKIKRPNQQQLNKLTAGEEEEEEIKKKKYLEEDREEVAFSLLKKKVAEVHGEVRDRVMTALYHQGRSSMEEQLLVVNKIINREKGSEKPKQNQVIEATPSTITEEKNEKINHDQKANLGNSDFDFEKKLEAFASRYKEIRETKQQKQIQVIKNPRPPAVQSSDRTNADNKRKRWLIAEEEEIKKKKKKCLDEDREEVAFSNLKKKVAEVREEHRDRVMTALYHQGRSSMEELLLVVNKITNQEKGSEKTKKNQVTEARPSSITEEKNEKVNSGNSATSVRATQEACSEIDYEKKLQATRIKLANQNTKAREMKERKQIQVIKNPSPPAVQSSDRNKADNSRKRLMAAAAALKRNKRPPRIVKKRIS